MRADGWSAFTSLNYQDVIPAHDDRGFALAKIPAIERLRFAMVEIICATIQRLIPHGGAREGTA